LIFKGLRKKSTCDPPSFCSYS